MRSKVADVTGNVKYICKSVFRHQNVGICPPHFCLGGYGAPVPPPMKENGRKGFSFPPHCVPLVLSCTHVSPFALSLQTPAIQPATTAV